MSAPREVWLSSSLPHVASYDKGGTEGCPQRFNLRYIRADLVTPLIEALIKINDGLREHDRTRRLDELQMITYRALATVREEMLL